MAIAVTGFIYAVLFFDTSVGVGEGRRIHNIGLMQQRIVGIVVTLVLAALAAVALWRWPRRESTQRRRIAGWIIVTVLLTGWIAFVAYAHLVITMLND